VNIGALDLKVAFAADESIRTEISAKFRRRCGSGVVGGRARASSTGTRTPTATSPSPCLGKTGRSGWFLTKQDH
jgi:hypothetical protein